MSNEKKNLVKPAMFHDEIMGVKDCKTLYNYAVPAMYPNPQMHSSLNSDPYNTEMIQTSILNIFENRVKFSINNILGNMMHKLCRIANEEGFHTEGVYNDIIIDEIQKQVPYLFELGFYYHIDPKNSELLKAVLMNTVSIIYNQLMDNLGYDADFRKGGPSVKEETIQNSNAIITGVCGEVFLELTKMAVGLISEAKGLYFEAGNLMIQNTVEVSKPNIDSELGESQVSKLNKFCADLYKVNPPYIGDYILVERYDGSVDKVIKNANGNSSFDLGEQGSIKLIGVAKFIKIDESTCNPIYEKFPINVNEMRKSGMNADEIIRTVSHLVGEFLEKGYSAYDLKMPDYNYGRESSSPEFLMNTNDVPQSRFIGHNDNGKSIYVREVSNPQQLKDLGYSDKQIFAMCPDKYLGYIIMVDYDDNKYRVDDSYYNNNHHFKFGIDIGKIKELILCSITDIDEDGEGCYAGQTISLNDLRKSGMEEEQIVKFVENRIDNFKFEDLNSEEMPNAEPIVNSRNKIRDFVVAIPHNGVLYNIFPDFKDGKTCYDLTGITNTLSKIVFCKYKNGGQDETKLIDLDQLRGTGMPENQIENYLYKIIDIFYN